MACTFTEQFIAGLTSNLSGRALRVYESIPSLGDCLEWHDIVRSLRLRMGLRKRLRVQGGIVVVKGSWYMYMITFYMWVILQ